MSDLPEKSVPSETGETSDTGNSEISESRKRQLANLKPYPPGVSGNPSGRPKKHPITEMYADILNDPDLAPRLRDAVVAMLFSGKMAAQLQLKEMAERVEGKVVQPVEGDINLNLGISDRLIRAKERIDGTDE